MSAEPPLPDSLLGSVGSAREQVARRAAELELHPPGSEAIRQGLLFAADAHEGPASTRTWTTLRIATVGDWRSPLADTADLGVVARELDDPLVADPDVLVFPRCEDMDFAKKADLVPERIWRRARDGQTTVVLDSSNEAFRFWRGHAQAMHDFLTARDIDPAHAVHLTEDRLYREDYEPWCAAEQLAAMRIVVFDAFIGRTLQAVRDNGRQVFEIRLAAYAKRPEHRSRRFVSLNFAARPTKTMFLMRLLRDGLFDRGWISFGGFSAEGGDAKLGKAKVLKRLGALHGFGEEAATLTPYADQLEAMGPVLFGLERSERRGAQRKQVIKADDLAEYADAWFTVVTETEMHPRAHRITEKPFKPLLNFHPFLVLGNPGSLAALRGYGFETCREIFDERYDEEPHPRRRFDMVYEQLVRLCAMDEAELARMTRQVSEVLTYNALWGLTELPRRFAETMTLGVIAQLAPPARRA